jgi:hypothetical protein
MNIDIIPGNILPDILHSSNKHEIPQALLLINYDERGIMLMDNLCDKSFLSIDEKTLIDLLQRIILNEKVSLGTRESLTDTFVDFILRSFDFEKYPLRLNIRPLYTFRVGCKRIKSECDFSIEKGSSVLLVEDDKHLKNSFRSDGFGEFQLAGEFLAAASTNYQNNPEDQVVFGVRVIGTRFTFYKAFFPKEYLYTLSDSIPEIKSTVHRMGNGERGYSFTVPKERVIILEILSCLKALFFEDGK